MAMFLKKSNLFFYFNFYFREKHVYSPPPVTKYGMELPPIRETSGPQQIPSAIKEACPWEIIFLVVVISPAGMKSMILKEDL